MKRIAITAVTLFAVLIFITFTAGCSLTGTENLKVGFLYTGSINDGGWTQSHDNARMSLEKVFGVETKYLENISGIKAAETTEAAEALISLGCRVVFATSPDYEGAILEIAETYPEIMFFICTPSRFEGIANISTYYGWIEEPLYLAGMAAGMKTVTGRIGFAASLPAPEAVRCINAFTLGARSVAPEAKVVVRWTGTLIDEIKIRETAEALLKDGCDVLVQNYGSSAPMLAAEAKGAFAIGYGTDTLDIAPKAYLTAPVFNWDEYYTTWVKEIKKDNAEFSQYYFNGMKDGVVGLADLTVNVPEVAADRINELKGRMEEGDFDIYAIFCGPIKNQQGKIMLEDGESIKEVALIGMNWFVAGVEGALPEAVKANK